jgi:hypothetical protein
MRTNSGQPAVTGLQKAIEQNTAAIAGGMIPHPPFSGKQSSKKRPLLGPVPRMTVQKSFTPVRSKKRVVDPTFAQALLVHNEKYKQETIQRNGSTSSSTLPPKSDPESLASSKSNIHEIDGRPGGAKKSLGPKALEPIMPIRRLEREHSKARDVQLTSNMKVAITAEFLPPSNSGRRGWSITEENNIGNNIGNKRWFELPRDGNTAAPPPQNEDVVATTTTVKTVREDGYRAKDTMKEDNIVPLPSRKMTVLPEPKTVLRSEGSTHEVQQVRQPLTEKSVSSSSDRKSSVVSSNMRRVSRVSQSQGKSMLNSEKSIRSLRLASLNVVEMAVEAVLGFMRNLQPRDVSRTTSSSMAMVEMKERRVAFEQKLNAIASQALPALYNEKVQNDDIHHMKQVVSKRLEPYLSDAEVERAHKLCEGLGLDERKRAVAEIRVVMDRLWEEQLREDADIQYKQQEREFQQMKVAQKEEIEALEQESSAKIQSAVRMRNARKMYKEVHVQRQKAATKIQTIYRVKSAKKRISRLKQERTLSRQKTDLKEKKHSGKVVSRKKRLAKDTDLDAKLLEPFKMLSSEMHVARTKSAFAAASALGVWRGGTPHDNVEVVLLREKLTFFHHLFTGAFKQHVSTVAAADHKGGGGGANMCIRAPLTAVKDLLNQHAAYVGYSEVPGSHERPQLGDAVVVILKEASSAGGEVVTWPQCAAALSAILPTWNSKKAEPISRCHLKNEAPDKLWIGQRWMMKSSPSLRASCRTNKTLAKKMMMQMEGRHNMLQSACLFHRKRKLESFDKARQTWASMINTDNDILYLDGNGSSWKDRSFALLSHIDAHNKKPVSQLWGRVSDMMWQSVTAVGLDADIFFAALSICQRHSKGKAMFLKAEQDFDVKAQELNRTVTGVPCCLVHSLQNEILEELEGVEQQCALHYYRTCHNQASSQHTHTPVHILQDVLSRLPEVDTMSLLHTLATILPVASAQKKADLIFKIISNFVGPLNNWIDEVIIFECLKSTVDCFGIPTNESRAVLLHLSHIPMVADSGAVRNQESHKATIDGGIERTTNSAIDALLFYCIGPLQIRIRKIMCAICNHKSPELCPLKNVVVKSILPFEDSFHRIMAILITMDESEVSLGKTTSPRRLLSRYEILKNDKFWSSAHQLFSEKDCAKMRSEIHIALASEIQKLVRGWLERRRVSKGALLQHRSAEEV